jgi:hypothetical protein
MDLNLVRLLGTTSPLTAIREFHRLKTRSERSEPLTIRDVQRLAAVRKLFEPRPTFVPGERERLMIAARRPAVIRARGESRSAVVIGLTLRVVHVETTAELAQGDWLRIAIPRTPDGRWHRFHGRVLRVDPAATRASIALIAPAGLRPHAAT